MHLQPAGWSEGSRRSTRSEDLRVRVNRFAPCRGARGYANGNRNVSHPFRVLTTNLIVFRWSATIGYYLAALRAATRLK